MTKLQRLFIATPVLCLFLVSDAALADVIRPPPDKCPAGGEPNSCFGGPYCRALICTANADCREGLTCQPLALCAKTINCAGRVAPGEDRSKYDYDDIKGFCGANDECATGATCKRLMVCAKPGADKPPSGGCTLSGAAPPAASVIVGLAVLVWVRRRQRLLARAGQPNR